METPSHYRYFDRTNRIINGLQYDFGFMHKPPGTKMSSCITCKIRPEHGIKRATITLVCIERNREYGKELLRLVEQEARELGVIEISLQAIGTRSLLTWYESQGYIYETEKHIRGTDQYAYSLYKYL